MNLIIFGNVYAHKNIIITQSYGNVEVIFSTGYYYEEINKALIIGQYAEELSKSLNFNNQITLFFKHNIGNYKEKYYQLNNSLNKNINPGEVFLDMKDEEFDVLDILKLVEYSIANINNLKDLDGLVIIEQNKNKKSKRIQKVVENKIYRPTIVNELKTPDNGISYFYKDDKFHVYHKENEVEKILFDFLNVYQISKIDDYSLLIFDTKESFYHLTNNRFREPSSKFEIKKSQQQILPYSVCKISNKLVSITFPEFTNKKDERVMLLDIKAKKLIQDIRSFFN